MLEPFDRLWWPDGLSSTEILWVWLGVRIEQEKVETSLFAFERGQAGLLGLVLVLSLSLFGMRWPQALRGPTFEPRPVVAYIE